jgi:hypothetical protein
MEERCCPLSHIGGGNSCGGVALNDTGRPEWLITAAEAAEATGMSPADLDRLIEAGRLAVLPQPEVGWVTTRRALRSARAPRRRHQPRSSASQKPAAASTSERRKTRVGEVEPEVVSAATLLEEARANLTRWNAEARAAAARRGTPQPEPVYERRLTVEEAAGQLRMTPIEVEQALQTGRLCGTRLGRQWITTTRAVADFRGDLSTSPHAPLRRERQRRPGEVKGDRGATGLARHRPERQARKRPCDSRGPTPPAVVPAGGCADRAA